MESNKSGELDPIEQSILQLREKCKYCFEKQKMSELNTQIDSLVAEIDQKLPTRRVLTLNPIQTKRSLNMKQKSLRKRG